MMSPWLGLKWRPLLAFIVMGHSLGGALPLAQAQGDVPMPVTPPLVASTPAAQPLILGKTTLDEARAIWAQSGAREVQAGLVAVGAGSGVDRLGDRAVPELLLVDVTGTDFEGLASARHVFVQGVLYAIQARLQPPVPSFQQGLIFPPVTDEVVSALEARLRKAHGPPSVSGRDSFDKKMPPNVFVWDMAKPGLKLVLSVRTMLGGSQLSLTHTALAKKAEQFKRAACRPHTGC